MCVCVWIFVCVYVYVYVYVYMCTYYIYICAKYSHFLCNLVKKCDFLREKLGIKFIPDPDWPDPDPK
jgi:hypothetical protein